MTLNFEELSFLLSKPESDTLDFKSEQYKLSDNESKSKFIKDILAFSNTKRSSAAYIFIGVDINKINKRNLITIDKQYDDSLFQSLIKDKINPIPKFLFYHVEHKGIMLGIFRIEVGLQRPYKPTKDFGILRKGTIYIRRGSTNEEANEDEIREMYLDFFLSRQLPNVEANNHIKKRIENLRNKISDYSESLSKIVAESLSIAQELKMEDDIKWLSLELNGYNRMSGKTDESLMDVIGIDDENHPIYSRIWGMRMIEGQIGVSTKSGVKPLDIPVFYPKSILELESNIKSTQYGQGYYSYWFKASDIPGIVEILKIDPDQDVEMIFTTDKIEKLGMTLRKEMFLFVHRAEMIILSSL